MTALPNGVSRPARREEDEPLPLTPKQERIWRYIKSCRRSPTHHEIAMELGYKERGAVSLAVLTLKEKGFVHYTPGKARSIVARDPRFDLASFPTALLEAELERRKGLDVGRQASMESR